MLQIHLHSSHHPLKYTRIAEIFPKNHQEYEVDKVAFT